MRNLVLSAAVLASATFVAMPASARIILAEVCSDNQSLVLVTTVTSEGTRERGICRATGEILFEVVDMDGSVHTFDDREDYEVARRELTAPAE